MGRIVGIVLGVGFIACGEPTPVPVSPSPAEQRVVSLSPIASEIVVSLGSGSRLVAVDPDSARILGLEGVPLVDADRIAEFEPDVVLAPGPLTAAARIAAPDAVLIEVAPHDLDDAYALCRAIGSALFRGREARRFARELSLPLAHISAGSFGQRRPRVAAVLDLAPLVIGGGHSFATDLIEIAGAESVGHGSEEPRLLWSRADLERAAPELVVVMTRHPLSDAEQTQARDGFGPDIPVEFLVFDPDRFWLSDPVPLARQMRVWVEALTRDDVASE